MWTAAEGAGALASPFAETPIPPALPVRCSRGSFHWLSLRGDIMLAVYRMSKDDTQITELSFEAAMERLEQIVEQMESSKLRLEDLLARYEEGTKLIAICNRRLQAAENRIETLTRDAAAAKPPGPTTERTKEPRKNPNEEIGLF
jgi:exodeoxyribonuclease VII small subunit